MVLEGAGDGGLQFLPDGDLLRVLHRHPRQARGQDLQPVAEPLQLFDVIPENLLGDAREGGHRGAHARISANSSRMRRSRVAGEGWTPGGSEPSRSASRLALD